MAGQYISDVGVCSGNQTKTGHEATVEVESLMPES